LRQLERFGINLKNELMIRYSGQEILNQVALQGLFKFKSGHIFC